MFRIYCYGFAALLTSCIGVSFVRARWKRNEFDAEKFELMSRLPDETLLDRATYSVGRGGDNDFVKFIDDDVNNNVELEKYQRSSDISLHRQHDLPAEPNLRDIERELRRLDQLRMETVGRLLRQQRENYGTDNSKNGSEMTWQQSSNIDEVSKSSRKAAPHFSYTPPSLLAVDPRCNSESLQRIMLENMGDNIKESKRAIIQAAEALIGGSFNVICAQTHFSYLTTTRLFCLVVKPNAKCYAFLTDTSADVPSGSVDSSTASTADNFKRRRR